MIRVQREDFDVGRELERLSAGDHTVGGVASFIGLVRDFNLQGGSSASSAERVSAMTLEHYPGMTERKLAEIEAEANRRWPLAACHFLIDWLKTEAPFWKSEETPEGERWVETRAEDDAAKSRWSRDD